jgi:hypothetical protein
MKQLVYATPVNTIEELTARVTQVPENIRSNLLHMMLVRTQDSMARRPQACIDNAGTHFENLLYILIIIINEVNLCVLT